MKVHTIFLIVSVLLCSGELSSQTSGKKINITGQVKDSLQRPVTGARILIDNMKTSASTNSDGLYKIIVGRSAKEISVVLPLNVKSTEIIDGRQVINFTLHWAADLSVDSVSTPKNRKKEHAGQMGEVTHRFSTYSSIYEMIKSELNGVQVRGTSVYIQGAASFGGSSEALFVVDGIIAEQINDILPNDVKSIELLKGPAAAAFGMRGANGVVVLTTFRGTNQK